MSTHDDNFELDEVTENERTEAEQFAAAVAALERGRAGLDELPLDGAQAELMPMHHVLRAKGPAGSLGESRREAVWSDIESRLEQAAAARVQTRPRVRWWHVALGLAATAAAVFLVIW